MTRANQDITSTVQNQYSWLGTTKKISQRSPDSFPHGKVGSGCETRPRIAHAHTGTHWYCLWVLMPSAHKPVLIVSNISWSEQSAPNFYCRSGPVLPSHVVACCSAYFIGLPKSRLLTQHIQEIAQ